MSQGMKFSDVVRQRHSVRSFLPTPLPEDVLQSVLQDAQMAPSNCNTQPWSVHIASGATRSRLSAALLKADEAGVLTPDFGFALNDYPGIYLERGRAQGIAYYKAIGVAREAIDDRSTAALRNLEFYGAPHVAFLFMPHVGDDVRAAGDLGMYGQTLLLSLTAHGLGGIPQTMLGFYAQTVRDVLGIDPAFKLLFGISFGYPDTSSFGSDYRIGKAPVAESVITHQ